ncbi:MAG: caspase family protein, partial [Pseudomonadota bacterium]
MVDDQAREPARGVVLAGASSADAVNERRVALVIGNGAYESAPLRNPVNDANDMAASL